MARNPEQQDAPVELSFREATEADLPSILGLYLGDPISAQRERHDELGPYRRLPDRSLPNPARRFEPSHVGFKRPL